MGKDLHPSILEFFHEKVGNHQNVKQIENIPNSSHYIFRIIRQSGMRNIVIMLSDDYHYGELDFELRPSELSDGGFILIAKPESHFSKDDQVNHIDEKIIIGKIGILLGALRVNDFWTYQKSIKKPTK